MKKIKNNNLIMWNIMSTYLCLMLRSMVGILIGSTAATVVTCLLMGQGLSHLVEYKSIFLRYLILLLILDFPRTFCAVRKAFQQSKSCCGM